MPSEYNPDETARDWEVLQDNGDDDQTERLRVVGGWLYRTRTGIGVALAFVPAAEGK
jgi:hypothetical protein